MDVPPPDSDDVDDDSDDVDYEVIEFHPDTSHGHIVSMLRRRAERGVVIDLGCGSAPLAEPLRESGFVYVGLDVNEHCLDALRQRGFAAHRVDLRRLDDLGDALDGAVAAARSVDTRGATGPPNAPDGDGRSDPTGPPEVVAVLALDVVEHLVEPHVAIHAIASWMQRRAVGVFGLSVPNVTHRDVGVKLLAARWDLTPTGLLDATHLRFFTASSLGAITAACGLRELDRMDTVAEWSDQHRPVGLAQLHTTTPLGRFLADLRARADEHGATYQFVRLFEPVAVPAEAPAMPQHPSAGDVDVRLAVVAATDLSPDEVDALRADLDAQTSDAWELVDADAWPGAGCSHVTAVGAGERLGPRWVEQFVDAGAQWHGMVLRCGPGPMAAHDRTWPPQFDPADDGGLRATPAAALAFPVASLGALGGAIASEIGDVSGGAVHRLALDLARFCGVHDTGEGAVAATRAGAPTPPETDQGVDGTERADAPHDDGGHDDRGHGDHGHGGAAGFPAPVLVERSDVDALAELRSTAARQTDALAQAASERDALAHDNAWLNAELRRTPVRIVRRLLRRPPGPS